MNNPPLTGLHISPGNSIGPAAPSNYRKAKWKGYYNNCSHFITNYSKFY